MFVVLGWDLTLPFASSSCSSPLGYLQVTLPDGKGLCQVQGRRKKESTGGVVDSE